MKLFLAAVSALLASLLPTLSSGTITLPTLALGGAVGLLALAPLLAQLRRRGRRDTHGQLEALDAYFAVVREADVDDCGKKLVCYVQTRRAEDLSEEEALISALFDTSEPFNPSSSKAEYDLASYFGTIMKSENACSRRYSKCPVDSKTISQAFQKGVFAKKV